MRIFLHITRTGFLVLVGMACLFALESSLFLSGRTFMRVTQPVVELLFANLGGVMLGALLMDVCWAKRAPAWRARVFPFCLFGAALCGAVSYMGQGALSLYVGSFCSGVPLAALLAAFFSRIPPSNQGVYMGAAMSLGHGVVLFYMLPGMIEGGNLRPLVLGGLVLMAGAAAALAHAVGVVPANICQRTPDRPASSSPEKNAQRRTRATMYYLIAVAGCYFLFAGVVSVVFFQYDATVPIPRHVFLFVSVGYVFIGLYIDQKGAGIRFLLCCFGATILTPALVVISESTLSYMIIYTICIAARYGVFMFLTLVFSRYACATRATGGTLCLPYILQYGAFLLVWHFCEITHPGPAAVLLPTIFLVGAFGYNSMRVRHALTLAGFGTKPAASAQEEVVRGSEQGSQAYWLGFSEKFGLSPRESEVLQWLVLGHGPDEIGSRLNVSTSTVKTHISQILRKTDSSSRLLLVVRYYTGQPAVVASPAKEIVQSEQRGRS